MYAQLVRSFTLSLLFDCWLFWEFWLFGSVAYEAPLWLRGAFLCSKPLITLTNHSVHTLKIRQSRQILPRKQEKPAAAVLHQARFDQSKSARALCFDSRPPLRDRSADFIPQDRRSTHRSRTIASDVGGGRSSGLKSALLPACTACRYKAARHALGALATIARA